MPYSKNLEWKQMTKQEYCAVPKCSNTVNPISNRKKQRKIKTSNGMKKLCGDCADEFQSHLTSISNNPNTVTPEGTVQICELCGHEMTRRSIREWLFSAPKMYKLGIDDMGFPYEPVSDICSHCRDSFDEAWEQTKQRYQ